jgi:hypothetical protein
MFHGGSLRIYPFEAFGKALNDGGHCIFLLNYFIEVVLKEGMKGKKGHSPIIYSLPGGKGQGMGAFLVQN